MSNQTGSRGRLPACDGEPLWDPRADLWMARLREINQRARPAPLPLLVELGEWWG